jgi:hypothetical protein
MGCCPAVAFGVVRRDPAFAHAYAREGVEQYTLLVTAMQQTLKNASRAPSTGTSPWPTRRKRLHPGGCSTSWIASRGEGVSVRRKQFFGRDGA